MRKIIFIAVTLIVLVSCKNGKSVSQASFSAAQFSDSGYLASANVAAKSSARMMNSIETADYEVYEDSSFEESEAFERKLIKNGRISIQVDSLENANEQIEKWAKSLGGYISNSQMSKYVYSYTARIPSEKFDDAMKILDGLGELKNRSVYIEDVSERYYDLQSRLETKKILQEKYNQYLKQAQSMKDLLEVERQLNDVISELESMEGQLRRLNSQIDFSTITVSLEAEVPSYETQRHIKGFDFKNFLYDVGDFFVGLVKVLIYIIIYGIPILILLSFFYWLLLGKLGLLKKLFFVLHGKIKKSEKKSAEESKNE